jgi:hypothetical protein
LATTKQASVAASSSVCGRGGNVSGVMDEGYPIAYEVLERGICVYASGGEQVGTVDHLIRRQQAICERADSLRGRLNLPRLTDDPILPHRDLRELAMHIQTNHACHCTASFELIDGGRSGGQTTTTDSRSKRIRVSRRGGQVLTRARGATYMNGLPGLRLLPDAPVPDGRTVLTSPDATGIQAVRGHRAHLALFIPTTNAIEALNRQLRKATKTKDTSPTRRPPASSST